MNVKIRLMMGIIATCFLFIGIQSGEAAQQDDPIVAWEKLVKNRGKPAFANKAVDNSRIAQIKKLFEMQGFTEENVNALGLDHVIANLDASVLYKQLKPQDVVLLAFLQGWYGSPKHPYLFESMFSNLSSPLLFYYNSPAGQRIPVTIYYVFHMFLENQRGNPTASMNWTYRMKEAEAYYGHGEYNVEGKIHKFEQQ